MAGRKEAFCQEIDICRVFIVVSETSDSSFREGDGCDREYCPAVSVHEARGRAEPQDGQGPAGRAEDGAEIRGAERVHDPPRDRCAVPDGEGQEGTRGADGRPSATDHALSSREFQFHEPGHLHLPVFGPSDRRDMRSEMGGHRPCGRRDPDLEDDPADICGKRRRPPYRGHHRYRKDHKFDAVHTDREGLARHLAPPQEAGKQWFLCTHELT